MNETVTVVSPVSLSIYLKMLSGIYLNANETLSPINN